MLIWACALHCEAKPLIDRLRLQKISEPGDFDLYRHQQLDCVVSGIGGLNMAAAIGWAAAMHRQHRPLCWINLGIAGHARLEVGTLVRVSRISAEDQAHTIHLPPDPASDLPGEPLTSYNREQHLLARDTLVDMEGYAFMQKALRFSPAEWCQSIKIVSDNNDSPPHRDKQRISSLIEAQIDRIITFGDGLHARALAV